jgi:hypothetical protein
MSGYNTQESMTEYQNEAQHIHKIAKIINAFPLEKELEEYDRHLV